MGEPYFNDPNIGNKLISECLKQVPENGRILFLSLSLEGLTTNLQSLVFANDDLTFIRPDIEVCIGYRLGSQNTNIDLGQITVNNVQWSFYDLRRLRNYIVGGDEDTRYRALCAALFIIQKAKQE